MRLKVSHGGYPINVYQDIQNDVPVSVEVTLGVDKPR